MEKPIIGIRAVGSYMPEKTRTITSSEEMEVNIRVASEEETTYEMGANSIRDMVKRAGIQIDELEKQYFFVNQESYGDYLFQMHGRQIMDRVGVNRIVSFNMHQGGSSSLLLMRLLKNHLLVNKDVNFGIVGAPQSWEFHSVNRSLGDAILGDGAASLLLEKGYERHRILSIVNKTIGKYHDVIYNEVGGWKIPITDIPCREGKFVYKIHNIKKYKEIKDNMFSFLVPVIKKALQEANVSWEDIKKFVIHSPTPLMHEGFLKYFNLEEDQVIDTGGKYGFMCSSGLLLSLQTLIHDTYLNEGSKVLIISFGVDGNWGASVLEV